PRRDRDGRRIGGSGSAPSGRVRRASLHRGLAVGAQPDGRQDMRLFCFGLGYTALALARRYPGPVTGTVLSEEKRAELAAEGIDAQLFSEARVPSDTRRILVSVPPDAEGDPVLRRFPGRRADWVGYLSTIGVYGDTGGAMVDETAPLKPSGDRQRARV